MICIVLKAYCKSIKITPVNNPEWNPFAVDARGKNLWSELFENLIEICIGYCF